MPAARDVPAITRFPIDNSRLPLPGDLGVAWDENAHRASMRWDCRAFPSGQFVANSLCSDKAMVDTRWPGKKPPPCWSGVIYTD